MIEKCFLVSFVDLCEQQYINAYRHFEIDQNVFIFLIDEAHYSEQKIVLSKMRLFITKVLIEAIDRLVD